MLNGGKIVIDFEKTKGTSSNRGYLVGISHKITEPLISILNLSLYMALPKSGNRQPFFLEHFFQLPFSVPCSLNIFHENHGEES